MLALVALLAAVTAVIVGPATANGATAVPGAPTGAVPFMTEQPGGLHVAGYASDPDTTDPVRVVVIVDYHWAAARTANRSYYGHGVHGFDLQLRLSEGTHRVCVWARNIGRGADTQLRCVTQNYDYGPVGGVNQLASQPGSVRVEGWAYDNDRPTATLTAKITVDGVAHPTAAGFNRPDVTSLTSRTGTHHGIWLVLPVAQGSHNVCVTVVNVGYGTDNTLLCRTLFVSHSPLGASQPLAPSQGKLHVRGWAVDPDSPSAPVSMYLTIDGRPTTLLANQYRPDITPAHLPASTGHNHGYDALYPLAEGPHRVCVTARNVGEGADLALQCQSITLSFAPRAALEPVTATASTVHLTGWAVDPDTTAPVQVRITVDGALIRTLVANAPGVSYSWHRFDVTLPVSSGSHSICVTAVNVLYGTHDSAPACRGIAVNPAGSVPPDQRTPAPVSTSRYIRNIRGASLAEIAMLRNEGAADARANPSGHRYLILLDIGGQDQYDGGVVLSATTRFVTYGDLVRDVEAYAYGYHSAQRFAAPVTIAIGTNNDMDVSYSTGMAWAQQVVNPIGANAARFGNMSVVGANDIEPGFRASYYATSTWLSGYLHGTTRGFVNNGSADGCAWTVTNRSCNNGWTMSGLYHLAAGAAPTRTTNLPQVYNYTMADQWKYISLTGIGQGSPRIRFGGPLTEWTACAQDGGCGSITGPSAWSRLWQDLQSDPRLQVTSLPFSTDLRVDN